MKTCPICNAVAFDDASICFGCMYRYDGRAGGEAPDGETVLSPEGCDGAQEGVSRVFSDCAPPAFFIKMVPALEPSGGIAWSCSVDFGDAPSVA